MTDPTTPSVSHTIDAILVACWKGNYGVAKSQLEAIRNHVANIEAERDAARRDAERYAWLRHGDNDEYVVRNSDGSPLPILDPDVANPFLLRNEKLDAAIDAAMSGGTGECNG